MIDLNQNIFTGILKEENDPMGAAIYDGFKGKKGKLKVLSSLFDDDEIPVGTLLRTYSKMPLVEKKAIDECCLKAIDSPIKILDIGAGSGCHSVTLMKKLPKAEITSIDISPLGVKTMIEKGLKDVRHINFFNPAFKDQFDIIIMLMNGSGIIGRTENMEVFFKTLSNHLAPNGFLLMDSSDLKYLYEEEDGSFAIDINDDYYGQIDYKMEYHPLKGEAIKGESFDWLYIDFDTLSLYANQYGFDVEKIAEDSHYGYLAKIYKRKG